MTQNFEEKLYTLLDTSYIWKNEPMKKHTTFRVGGPADYFVTPPTEEALRKVVLLCREEGMPFYILGKGSNLLVGDKGYLGVMIQNLMNRISVEKETVTAQAGAGLAQVAAAALEAGLTGFEFAAGIPGTLGGAVVMNAGAYGGEMKDVLCRVHVMTGEGEFLTLEKEELELGYRPSVVAKKGYIVLEAVLCLQEGDREAIKARMEELRQKRLEKQPLEYPSAGSTFKRPEGYFAGKLIQDAGLKGFSVGGAQVSEKHSGFVINTGNATAADISGLISQVREKVHANSGVWLEPEVKRIGEF